MYRWFGFWWVEDEEEDCDHAAVVMAPSIRALIVRLKTVLRRLVNWGVNLGSKFTRVYGFGGQLLSQNCAIAED